MQGSSLHFLVFTHAELLSASLIFFGTAAISFPVIPRVIPRKVKVRNQLGNDPPIEDI